MDGTLQEKKDTKDEGLFEDEDWMLQVRPRSVVAAAQCEDC